MNKNYFRITGYNPQDNFCFIMDANGMFEEIWQFSSLLVQKKLKIIEVSSIENIIDINLNQIEEDTEHFYLRATADGRPEEVTQTINGITYKAVKVADKIYIPNKLQTI